MFKKLKDKLAEEVKSSPQRIQQFAQAAQAAVTSASSSISDITNSDLFSIGDNESQSSQTIKPSTSTGQANTFQEVSLMQPGSHSGSESINFAINHEDNPRQRRLSNSSFTSDISFRLPSYESPSMYHLQSDMEVSASEAEERGFSSGAISLDRVTKEQLYAAYRRTQERYTKYRTQYADLARHYKLLERENAKARSVLVETQDKALRRISELREQCSLEQSAKAHLEKALRVEIEEGNMKIEALNTKISLLQNINLSNIQTDENAQKGLVEANKKDENDVQLINLTPENDDAKSNSNEAPTPNDLGNLSSKIEKMEQLLNKYKESLKTSKEKNSQLTIELKKVSTELDNQVKENEMLKIIEVQLIEAQQKIQELNLNNEELNNKVNTYDFAKTKELSTLEMDLQKSKEEILQLRSKIEIFSKREEEYAISLAENKLSIHKELESKETEIKSLKDNLSAAKKELLSLNIIVNDYKSNLVALEEESSKLKSEVHDLNLNKGKITEMESQILVLTQKCQSLEQIKTKTEEELKCLQLQMKQETAEKLAMIDRNDYLEKRNALLIDENSKKGLQVSHLENELLLLQKEKSSGLDDDAKQKFIDEIELWKAKFNNLESEIQDERVELVKLQSEIEKLLRNHELIQSQNSELHGILEGAKKENFLLHQKVSQNKNTITMWESMADKVKDLQTNITLLSNEARAFKKEINIEIPKMRKNIITLDSFSQDYVALKNKYDKLEGDHQILQNDTKSVIEKLSLCSEELNAVKSNNEILSSELLLNASEKNTLLQEFKETTDKYNTTTQELNFIKNEKQSLLLKLEEVENKCLHLQTAVDDDNNQYLEALDKLKVIRDEKQTLMKKIDKIEKENELLNTEVEKLKIKHNDDLSHISSINSEKEQLVKAVQDKELLIENLNQKTTMLSQENISLKNQCESIANSVKNLEEELNEVRKSHAEIEGEKDRLNSIIEMLEKKEQAKELINKDIQTEINLQSNTNQSSNSKENEEIISLLKNIDVLNVKSSKYEEDIRYLKEANTQLTNKNVEITEENLKKVNSITAKCDQLQIDNDVLKEENKRLQSDVEGLQTYLAKISKENGVLNDKLRELIASSENTIRSDYQSDELLELQNEVLADKEKIDDLTRENTLLIEENLELKDQLQSQNYTDSKNSTNNNENYAITMEKYNNVLGTKNELEEKVVTLEQMNRSINGNMQQMQGHNEKLKLTNEKLERRLDEALVSLRHLHSLQENTELEYLKNILYEYLTGSGTHSVTLAKVLAAVVKFDDKQTQHVLQKEKERQGLLRQLGLL